MSGSQSTSDTATDGSGGDLFTRSLHAAERQFAQTPALGPTAALLIAVVVFSFGSDTFFNIDNFSFIVQQSLVIGTLALGQTVIILTGGIDLANALIAVLGTLVMTKVTLGGVPALGGLLLGVVVCCLVACISGLLVSRVRLPPFIVTLGMLTVVTAVANLYSNGTSWAVPDGLLTVLGFKLYLFGRIQFTIGMLVAAVLFFLVWLALTKTAWGRHVYAIGNDIEAARLNGINTKRALLSVYALAGCIYGIAAWVSMGRTPSADPNAYQLGNLESITAVVIGGTSLFGGRGGVVGTIVGALIVSVLRSGLTQMGIDSNYQNLATGILVIVAVAFDQFTRRRSA